MVMMMLMVMVIQYIKLGSILQIFTEMRIWGYGRY